MIATHSFVLQYLTLSRPLGYTLVFLGMVLEGEATLFTAAFLTHQGFFDPGDILGVVLGGLVVGDIFWYWLGTSLNHSASLVVRVLDRVAGPFDRQLRDHPVRSLFLSKFAYGLNHALLVRAGKLGLGARRVFGIEAITTPIWFGIVWALGYGSSASYALIKHSIRFVEIVFLASILTLFLASHALTHYLKKRL